MQIRNGQEPFLALWSLFLLYIFSEEEMLSQSFAIISKAGWLNTKGFFSQPLVNKLFPTLSDMCWATFVPYHMLDFRVNIQNALLYSSCSSLKFSFMGDANKSSATMAIHIPLHRFFLCFIMELWIIWHKDRLLFFLYSTYCSRVLMQMRFSRHWNTSCSHLSGEQV